MILIGYLYIGRPAGTSKQYLFVLRKVNSHRKWFLCTIYPEQSRAELFEEIRKSEKEKIHLSTDKAGLFEEITNSEKDFLEKIHL